jgi:hypothetical protein
MLYCQVKDRVMADRHVADGFIEIVVRKQRFLESLVKYG